jgi:curved DNA-binding protein CbpA
VPTPPSDYYSVLHLRPTADAEVIRAVYRILARRLEGAAGQSPHARQALIELNTAYWILSDPVRRAAYDRELSEGEPGGEGPVSTEPDAAEPEPSTTSPDQVSFGRYRGWTLREIVKRDPEYLLWLQRHSSGVRYRRQIAQLLQELRIP